MPEDQDMRLMINGDEHVVEPEDFELWEVELLEDTMGSSIELVDFTRAKAMRVLVYILLHRENPSVTMEDAGRIKFSSLAPAADESAEPEPKANGNAARKRPTKAAASG